MGAEGMGTVEATREEDTVELAMYIAEEVNISEFGRGRHEDRGGEVRYVQYTATDIMDGAGHVDSAAANLEYIPRWQKGR